MSDDPDNPLFYQILSFKVEIESLIRKWVDLISISKKAIYLNKTKKLDISNNANIKKKLKEIFQTKNYNFYIFSLNVKNLSLLFERERNILDFIGQDAEIFVFGAWSRLKALQRQNIHLSRRPGVSKLTKEFKEKVLSKINSQLKSVKLNNDSSSVKSSEIGNEK